MDKEMEAFAQLYFSDKDGALHENAMPHLALLCRCLLGQLLWLSRLEIGHGDIKPGNLVLVHATSGRPEWTYYTVEGDKMELRVCDYSGTSFEPQHWVYLSDPKQVNLYNPVTETLDLAVGGSTTTTPRARRALAAAVLEAADTVPRVSVQRSPGTYSKPEEIPLKAVHLQTGVIPSSMQAGEPAPYPIFVAVMGGGTPTYRPPEVHRKLEPGNRIRSKDRLPGDMFSAGCAILRIASGGMRRELPDDYHGKRVLCEADLPSLWCKFLGKNPRTGKTQEPVPDEWTEFLEFLQQILILRPDHRLTPAAALLHPFMDKAKMFRKEAIPRNTQMRTVGGRIMGKAQTPA